MNAAISAKRLDLKNRLRTRKRTLAAWTSIGHPSITEIFAQMKVDFVGIDIEHSTISLEQSQRIIETCQAHGVSCLPRIASHNGERIKRLLDAGADGLIVPMVNTASEAEKIVAWSKYPTLGIRNYGVSRAQNYGFEFDSYTKSWNDSSSVIIQIESIEAVKNVESMLANPHIDAAMIGPYDISGSLGIPGQIDHPKVTEACAKVIEVCKKMGKGCGTQVVDPDQASVEAKFGAGFTFVVLSSDIFLMWKWAERMREIVGTQRART